MSLLAALAGCPKDSGEDALALCTSLMKYYRPIIGLTAVGRNVAERLRRMNCVTRTSQCAELDTRPEVHADPSGITGGRIGTTSHEVVPIWELHVLVSPIRFSPSSTLRGGWWLQALSNSGCFFSLHETNSLCQVRGSHSGSPGVMSNLHVLGEGVELHDHAVLSTVFLGSQLPLFPDFAIRFDRFSSCQRRTAFQVCVGFSPPRSPRGSPPSRGSPSSSCLSSP